MQKISLKTEIRNLNQQERRKIENLLNSGEAWKNLISVLPKNLDNFDSNTFEIKNIQLLINNQKFELLEQQKYLKNGSPSKALLDYWSTFGFKRPTIEHLIYFSAKCNLKRLVNYLVNDLLNCKTKSDQEILISDCKTIKYLNEKKLIFDELDNKEDKEIISDLNISENLLIKFFSFDFLEINSNYFNENTVENNGSKIGEGGFGKVFLAKIPNNLIKLNCNLDENSQNYLIAVKIVKIEFKNQFLNELKYLTEFNHPNILNLIGISQNEENFCILSEYMVNGSLQNYLSKKVNNDLSYEIRIKIIKQIIDAICYLHSFKEKCLIHRDIKSSNILLNKNLDIKICDFGLSRLILPNNKTISTQNIIGTSVYMAPEAFKGDISVKIDTFSFGIVLLEILTGLPSTNEETYTDILSYVSENLFEESDDESEDNEINLKEKILQLLDKKVNDWNLKVVYELFELAKRCTRVRKIKRPTMLEVQINFSQIIET